jgi:hypothetical protein
MSTTFDAAICEFEDAMRRWSDSNNGVPMIAVTLESARDLRDALKEVDNGS